MNYDPTRLLQYLEQLETLPDPEYDWKPVNEPPPSYFRELKIIAPPVWHPPTDDLATVRTRLRETIEEYLMQPYPTHRLLIKALPGTGKTTASVAALDALYIHRKQRRTLYAGPRHDFFKDLQAITQFPQTWYEWQPRRRGTEDLPETCQYTDEITSYMHKGFQALDFCQGVCKWDYVREVCPWHKQKARPEPVIYGQHQHVVLGHPLEFHVLLGDESPLQVFTREWRIPAKWILPPGMDPTDPLTELLKLMSFLAEQTTNKKPLLGEQLLKMLGGAGDVVAACEPHAARLETLDVDLYSPGGIYQATEVEKIPYAHLSASIPLLFREAKRALAGEKYPHRIILGGGHMTLLLRHKLRKDSLPPWIVWLDATARPDLYERVFECEFKVIDASPKMQGTIYQVTNRTNGRSALIDRETKTLKQQTTDTLALIKQLCEKYAYQRPALISFKQAVAELDWIDTGHFYASRGTNAFQEADAIFIYGAPMPSLLSLVNTAKMLFFERDDAFRVVWSDADVPYQYVDPEDGMGRAYPVAGFWGDPDLNAVLRAHREDEIIQAAHRIRPVNKPCDIWLFTNLPIEGLAPDQLVSMHELQGAPENVRLGPWIKVQALMEKQDTITSQDLQALGMSNKTALKYLALIAETPGWETTKAVTRARGKPAIVLTKVHDATRNNVYLRY